MRPYATYLFLMCGLFCFLKRTEAQTGSIFSVVYKTSVLKNSVGYYLKDLDNKKINVEYSSTHFDTSAVVKLHSNEMSVGKLLRQLFNNQNVRIVEQGNKILIIPSKDALNEDFFPEEYSVFGYVRDKETSEPLPFALVYEPILKKYTEADQNGFYTLRIAEGKRRLVVSYTGYDDLQNIIKLDGNTKTDLLIAQKKILTNVQVQTAVPATGTKITAAENKEYFDNVLGEQDAMRSLYLLPGVQNIPDVTNGLLVRGGGADQNLFFLDGTVIYNPSHLLGMISIINKTALKSLSFYKSNFPSYYGGSVSSVTAVTTKDGNMKKWEGRVNLGFLAASAGIEGPLVKDKTALSISVRKSWVNPFLRLMNSSFGVDFYDAQIKLTQQLSKTDKLSLMAYSGADQMRLYFETYNNKQSWGNQAASLTWNKILGPQTVFESKVSKTAYKNIAGFTYNMFDSLGTNQIQRVYNTFSSLSEFNFSNNIKHSFNNDFRLQAGTQYNSILSKPFNSNVLSNFAENENDFTGPQSFPYSLFAVYAEADKKIDSSWFTRIGFRLSNFVNNGYKSTALQPRLMIGYRFSNNQQLQLSFDRMTQYQHRVTNPYLGINNDIWLPAAKELKPEFSNMINLGYKYRTKNKWLLNADVYGQFLNNVTNYGEGKNLFLNNGDWEKSIETGKGYAYGLELEADKKTEKWELRIAYTLAKNLRRFTNINNGKLFPFKYDRRHYVNIAGNYMITNKINVSGLWTFATGDLYSVPDLLYPDFDNTQQIFDPNSPQQYRLIYQSSGLHQYRALPYHRLDVSSSWQHLLMHKLRSSLTAGIYNIYGAPSQYIYDIEGTLGKRSLVVTSKYQFFSVTPYISYNIAF